MRCLLFLSFFVSCCYSCARSKQELPETLQAIIKNSRHCICEPYIDEYVWRNKTVFLHTCAGAACDCMTQYYDAKGILIKMDSGYLPNNFVDEARFVAQTWRCKPL